jgi:hypothetical protein
MSVECANTIVELIDAFESGEHTYPIFWSDSKCNGDRWPPPQNDIPLSQFNIDLTKDLFCKSSKKEDCPLPSIFSAFIPDGIQISFLAKSSSKVNNRGMYISTSEDADSGTNVYNVVHDQSSKQRWALASKFGIPEDDNTCNGTYISTDGKTSFDNDGKMLVSITSCGTPFWPSFLGRSANYEWDTGQHFTCNTKIGKDDFDFLHCQNFDFSIKQQPVPFTGYGTYALFYGPNIKNEFNANKMFECECQFTKDEQCPGDTCNPGKTQSNRVLTSCGSILLQSVCTHTRFSGSTESMKISYEEGSWFKQQAKYCVDGLKISGQQIKLYGSTPFCDNIMELACADTIVTSDPFFKKACRCINESKRIQTQFAGVDLPIQCFLDVCNDHSQGVYVKSSQTNTPCSAKLCRQIIDINGTGITASGTQELMCNGEIYNVQNAPKNVQPVPIVTPTDNKSKTVFQLGPVFYISLAFFLFMLILVIAWIIRRIVTHRKSTFIQNSKLEQQLQQKLQI